MIINKIKDEVINHLKNRLNELYGIDSKIIVEIPKDKSLGDLAFPSFSLCKDLRKSPMEIAPIIKNILEELNYFKTINIVGAYVNAEFNRELLAKLIFDNIDNKIKTSDIKGTVCIDYSSPNIAKSFSVGHLRSTIIGEAIGNLLEWNNYKVVRINHLGDFGTQFGKLIYAYLNWGDEEVVKKDPINELVSLYVRFHEEETRNPELEDKARQIFNELESGNQKYLDLWNKFISYSRTEFDRMYKLLNVHFDEYSSEAKASRRAKNVLSLLDEHHLLEESDGATVVRIGDDIPPAIVKRTDGATLYITRDLQEIHDRYDKYNFDRILYVVGNEQKLYFEQLKRVLGRLNSPFKDSVSHVNFGLVLRDGKKMSTRTGNAVKLDDVLKESVRLAYSHINEKNPNLANKELIAEKVGISAIIFNDLKNYRENDYEFNLEEATKFEGQTGPYLQYTSVRISSILKASKESIFNNNDFSYYNNDSFFEIVKCLDDFDDIIVKATNELSPNILAKYLLNLASMFNSFYAKEKCLCDDIKERHTKLKLINEIKTRIDDGMKLLGMSIVEEM